MTLSSTYSVLPDSFLHAAWLPSCRRVLWCPGFNRTLHASIKELKLSTGRCDFLADVNWSHVAVLARTLDLHVDSSSLSAGGLYTARVARPKSNLTLNALLACPNRLTPSPAPSSCRSASTRPEPPEHACVQGQCQSVAPLTLDLLGPPHQPSVNRLSGFNACSSVQLCSGPWVLFIFSASESPRLVHAHIDGEYHCCVRLSWADASMFPSWSIPYFFHDPHIPDPPAISLLNLASPTTAILLSVKSSPADAWPIVHSRHCMFALICCRAERHV